MIEEWTTGGVQLAHYVHGPRMDELLVKVSTTNAVYYHHDALGNTTHLTATNGAVVEKYSYDIFGAVTIKDGGGTVLGVTAYVNRFLFTGRKWLADIGLYDYRNRIYSQELGRFLQTDPILFDAGDVGLYRYVGNNPMNVTDPLGLYTYSMSTIPSAPFQIYSNPTSGRFFWDFLVIFCWGSGAEPPERTAKRAMGSPSVRSQGGASVGSPLAALLVLVGGG